MSKQVCTGWNLKVKYVQNKSYVKIVKKIIMQY